jgi:hypothetical protein
MMDRGLAHASAVDMKSGIAAFTTTACPAKSAAVQKTPSHQEKHRASPGLGDWGLAPRITIIHSIYITQAVRAGAV